MSRKVVSEKVTHQFLQSNYIRQNALGLFGFFVGMKISDYFLYDHDKIEIVKETMEDEFWQKYGEPRHIKPDVLPYRDPSKSDQMRKTWIMIKYEKDSYVPKVDK